MDGVLHQEYLLSSLSLSLPLSYRSPTPSRRRTILLANSPNVTSQFQSLNMTDTTQTLLDNNNNSGTIDGDVAGEDIIDKIPLKVFQALEITLKQLQQQLLAKDVSLQEKDEVVEVSYLILSLSYLSTLSLSIYLSILLSISSLSLHL